MDSSFIARPVRLFGIGLAAIFFGCNSAPPTHRDSTPSSVQVDGGIASAAAADTGAAGAGGEAFPSAAADGAAGTGGPHNGDQGAAGAVAISATDPSDGGSGGAIATGTTDPSGDSGGAHAISATDPSGGSGRAIAIGATDPSGGGGGAIATSTADTGGADGGAPVCEGSEMRCSEGCTETCQPNGTWGPAISCPGGHQTCGGSPGQAKCVCKVYDVCTTTGPSCAGDSIATCAKDEDGCLFPTTTPCPDHMTCGGTAGQASCVCKVETTLPLPEAGGICDDSCFITCLKDANGCIYRSPIAQCAHTCEGLPGNGFCDEGPCTTVGETRCESDSSLETCSATAGGGPTFVAKDCAAGTVCGRNAPASCLDPNWADWPMPNGLLDAANGAPHPQRFTDNGDGSLTDTVTGLEWESFYFIAPTFADAVLLCQETHLLDEGDWRVPSLIELISLADFGEPSNINETFFPPPHDFQLWTTTLGGGDGSDEHFAFDFALGQVSLIDDQSQDDLHPHAINCVR